MSVRLTGTKLKLAIMRSKFLPDYPTPFRKQAVVLALAQDGIEAPPHSTLDAALLSLLSSGYMVRTEFPENPNAMRPYHLWMFSRADRTSNRPGFEPGGRYDLWRKEQS